MTRAKLDILTTGGTIASRYKRPMASGDEVASELRTLFSDVDIAIHEICRRGSSQITTDILWNIGVQVRRSFQDGADGVVVTHGTDTLEETAYFLDLVGRCLGPQGVRYTVKPVERTHVEYKGLVTPVDLVKASLDSGDRLIRAAVQSGARGLVIESLGHGHLPPDMAAAFRDAVQRGIPVVVTTRCLSGGGPLSVSDDPVEIAGMFRQNP